MSKGATRLRINLETLVSLPIPVPPLEEQAAIVAFLDRETARIDAVIAAKARLIALLEEKRAALVNHAVTKGLDPTAPTTPSGTDFLGAVPVHWSVERLRLSLVAIEQGWSPQCESRPAEPGEWGVLKVGCVNYGRFEPTENKALPTDLDTRPELEVRNGDVLMSRANTPDLVGGIAHVADAGRQLLLCDKLYRLTFDAARLQPEFAVIVINSQYVRRQIELVCSGASSSMQNISHEKVRDLVLARPPVGEQAQIIARVEAETARITAMIAACWRSIDLAREKRQALVTAAVTGQLDIGATAPQPVEEAAAS